MSVATFDPNTVTMTWGPIVMVGFEGGEFITAELAVPQRYSRKQAFGRAIHTKSTDTGGTVTVRLQADSPSIALIMTQIVADLAPGGNVLLPLLVKTRTRSGGRPTPIARRRACRRRPRRPPGPSGLAAEHQIGEPHASALQDMCQTSPACQTCWNLEKYCVELAAA